MKIVLMYHDVVSMSHPKSGFPKVGALQYTLDSRAFSEQVSKYSKGKIVFSFDDGGDSFYNEIAPILEQNNQKGIFFISTQYIDTSHFLTKDRIKDLDVRGHIIASHSHTHPAKISSLSREECLKEWKESKQILESIVGHEVTAGSIPGGAVSNMVIDCMIDVGYKDIYTSEPTTKVRCYRGAKIIGRYGITRNMNNRNISELVNSKCYRNKLLLKYHVFRFAKIVLGSQYNRIKQFLLRILG